MPRPSVRFASRTNVYLVPSLSDMTDKEIASVWTSKEESKSIQHDMVKTIRAMRSRSTKRLDQDDVVCHRGLEHMLSPQHMENRKSSKESVIDAVLDEQDLQFDAGIYDESRLAMASALTSKQASVRALVLAEVDAAYVRHMRTDPSPHSPGSSLEGKEDRHIHMKEGTHTSSTSWQCNTVY